MTAPKSLPVVYLLQLHEVHRCFLEHWTHGFHMPRQLSQADSHTAAEVLPPILVEAPANYPPMCSPAVQHLKCKCCFPRPPENTVFPAIGQQLALATSCLAFAVPELHPLHRSCHVDAAGSVVPNPPPAADFIVNCTTLVYEAALTAYLLLPLLIAGCNSMWQG